MSCDCKHCKRSIRIDLILNEGSNDQLKALVHELLNDLRQVEEDLNYHQAILDGSWPSSVRQLKQALAKAIEIHKDEMLEEVEKKLDMRS